MKKTTKKIASVILAVIMVFSCCGTAFAYSGRIDPAIVAETSKIALEIENEGIVLLKNEENLLPLDGKKLNVFGVGSVRPFFGGAGSGCITSENPISFYDALDAEGIEYNTELRKLYEKNCGDEAIPTTKHPVVNNALGLILTTSSLDEMPVKKLTKKVMDNAVAYSDTALIMISRTSEEGADLEDEVLRLSETEEALVEKVNASFENVIVLFNIANIIEMGFVDKYENIKAAACIWIPGEFGMLSVAKMLKGEVNPSGRLADTVAYSSKDHPSGVCFGTNKYKGGGYYVEYLEGIYVGYRYFETFAKDRVQYPFGYGLSYTQFSKELVSYSTENGIISADVKVTNTGAVAGKDVVQLYYSAPYYDGGIEKSAICLGAFDKTKLLAPGESETLTISFEAEDMASYDHKNNEAWILEKGTYKIILGENVREHIDSFDYVIAEDKVMKYDDVTGTEISNKFDDVFNDFPVLSRASGAASFPTYRELSATDETKNVDKIPDTKAEGVAPTVGAVYDETIMLKDVYNDMSLMDKFLDQLTVNEMVMMVIDGGYGTRGVERLGIPQTWDNDAPSSVKGPKGIAFTDSGTAYPCEVAVACTWNTDLAETMGKCVGIEARDLHTDIWYAPGVNLHRNPAGGRNYEYYSEDPLLSGKMAAAVIRGCDSEGLVVTIKHFVLNDQESHREGVFTWADEQTMRELYLKAFEIPIKESNCMGVMSAFNRIGTKWCGSSSALLKDLLRDEWGYEGFVVSDYSWNFTGTGYMNPVIAVYNGNDTMLTGIWAVNMPSHVITTTMQYYKDPVGFGTALREACRNLCMVKMQTKAFLEPYEYDASLIGSLTTPEEWGFEPPYISDIIWYVLNNLLNVIIYFVRFIL
ncbi:MAG: glycoside hydrolase family 3 protein [Clostridia bacterium]|nr:glycoside hydrolase family 3 protein [Clostridia bacterium]